MKYVLRAALLAMTLLVAGSQAAGLAAQDDKIPPQLLALEKNLRPKHGKIPIAAAKATLDLGDQYDFYDAADARTILVDLWGNPPANADGVLGLVMPAGASPLRSDSWGAVVTYEDSGYVADDDAASADFGSILDQLKQGTEEANAERTKQGYPAMHVAGWAESPHYDKASHSVIWARDLRIEGAPVDSLNYDLRTLGRRGVLSLNFISVMPSLPAIRLAAADFADHASFDAGSRYRDFDAGRDKKAEYGIAGLVAAGVGVVAVKKLGLLALILKFGKVIFVAVAAGLVAVRKFVARMFGFGKAEEAGEVYYTEPETVDPAPRADLSGLPGGDAARDP
ncbi:MAG: DUF2167 domain-containing protein [Novosphingobium sp.]|nr:DUF2167 domain-containing protein [Novosphingobium sp.]MBO9602906.1 DUF2167 domain-containing protein [Novosphingobium sp.]